jgi:DDE family transposase
MFCTTTKPNSLWRFELVRRSFLQQPGLPFADALSEERLEQALIDEDISFGDEQPDEVIYTPAVTLWAFLSQMLFTGAQRSCVAAVARVSVLWASLGQKVCDGNTGAYCRARHKLTEGLVQRLVRETAEACEAQTPDRWLWLNRHVWLVDGTTISMPDTPENQAAYPQPPAQKPGLGFPLLRLVALVSLATGLLRDAVVGPYAGKEAGETALLRELFGRLQAGDVVLADRVYCGWLMIALLQELNVDLVVRLHQLRKADFSRGQRLGPGDHLVEWPRPPRPDWMDEATYARMPATLRVREVEVQVKEPGFRTQSLVVVTTLTDAEETPRDALADLYRQRWLVELDIRSIKSMLSLDVLRCKTPQMVRKELYTGLLAYNLIRQTMLQAALAADVSPRSLSFTAAMQTLAAAGMVAAIGVGDLSLLIQMKLEHIASHRVGHRPGRIEPRAIKRRPKPHKLLTEPRPLARARLHTQQLS